MAEILSTNVYAITRTSFLDKLCPSAFYIHRSPMIHYMNFTIINSHKIDIHQPYFISLFKENECNFQKDINQVMLWSK